MLLESSTTARYGTNHPVLRVLVPAHAMVPTPGGDRTVACIGPEPAGLLVAVQRERTQPLVQHVQHLDDRRHVNLQRSAQRFELRIQTQQAFTHKLPLSVTDARLVPVLKLYGVDAQDRACGRCVCQCRMVSYTQVALEPDHLGRTRWGDRRKGAHEGSPLTTKTYSLTIMDEIVLYVLDCAQFVIAIFSWSSSTASCTHCDARSRSKATSTPKAAWKDNG